MRQLWYIMAIKVSSKQQDCNIGRTLINVNTSTFPRLEKVKSQIYYR